MNKQTKKILIWGGVAVVAFLLVKKYNESRKAPMPAKANDSNTASFAGGGQIVLDKTGMSNAAAQAEARARWQGSGAQSNKTVLS